MGMPQNKFWKIKNLGSGTAEIWIYEQIGFDWWTWEGIDAKDLCQEIASLNVMNIDVHIMSPGGSVFDGIAIYNALKRHPARITTFNDGYTASIASVIFCAGDCRVTSAGAVLMIHLPTTDCTGNADDMRKAADLLDTVRDSLVSIYRKVTTLSDEEIVAAMEAETYYTGEQSLQYGFATEMGDDLQIAACSRKFDFRALGYHQPPRYTNSTTVNGPGKLNALHLVQEGKVDRDSAWSFSADDGDKILGEPADWSAYAKWFLGLDSAAGKETKDYYKYPFGKDGKVYRSGIIAVKDRAAQQGESEIETAAGHILDEIDKDSSTGGSSNRKKTGVKNRKPVASATDPDRDPDGDPDEDCPEGQPCFCTGMAPSKECSGCGANDYCINPTRTTAANVAQTKPQGAHYQEVSVMTQQAAAPAPGARDFQKESAEIVAMCVRSGCADKASDFITSGLSPDQVGNKILDLFHSGVLATPAAEAPPIVDLGKNSKNYSYTKAIALMANQQLNKEKPSGLEWEVHQDLVKNCGVSYSDRGGILIPHRTSGAGDPSTRNALAQATMALKNGNTAEALRVLNTALSTTGTNTGKETVFQEYGEFIDLLRNMMVCTKMGARVLTGLKGPVNFPKQTGAQSLYWTGENAGSDVTQSNVAFSTVTLSPKTCMAQGAMSRQLIIESTPDVEGIVRNDFAMIHALGWDFTALHGTGLSNQPTGLYNLAGVNAVPMAGMPTYKLLVSMITAVATFNALLGKTGWVTNPLMAGALMTTLDFPSSASGRAIWQGKHTDGVMAGYDAMSSNQVLANMGAGTNEVGTLFGNWDDLLIGMWGALEILVDPYTLAGQGLLKITSFQMIDIAARRAQSFSKSTGAIIS